MGLLRFLEWIESKVDRPAKRHAIFPGSEQMVDSDVAKAQDENGQETRDD